jgi:hypothetical protein
MIIDYTYFTEMLGVGISPYTGASPVTNEAEADRINAYAEVYEREYLEKILGDDMCSEFLSYIESRENRVDKWEKLYALLSEKYSPIACYVFFKYISEANYSVTGVGVVTSSDDDTVSPNVLQIRVWNDMVNMNKRVYKLLMDDEYKGVCFNPCMLRKINSMGI